MRRSSVLTRKRVCVLAYLQKTRRSVIEDVESCVKHLPSVVITDEREMDLERFKGIKHAASNLAPE